jgi:hypothetical protein
MAPAGMVHALQTIARMLKPDGALIDIHPGSDRPEIVVHTGAGAHFVGTLDEAGGLAEYRQAQAALDQAVGDGTFVLEHQGVFAFAIHAGSLADLQGYFAEHWKDAILDPAVVQAAEAVLGRRGDGEIVVTEQILIARLRLKQ